jgi:hypothetical protein
MDDREREVNYVRLDSLGQRPAPSPIFPNDTRIVIEQLARRRLRQLTAFFKYQDRKMSQGEIAKARKHEKGANSGITVVCANTLCACRVSILLSCFRDRSAAR